MSKFGEGINQFAETAKAKIKLEIDKIEKLQENQPRTTKKIKTYLKIFLKYLQVFKTSSKIV
uniref:Uncharacterized protein n=1 Tax=Desertifilum tharense IPPAS B-1220 TaxID=1781255 RepID=A0ACD5GWH4_9CYAN